MACDLTLWFVVFVIVAFVVAFVVAVVVAVVVVVVVGFLVCSGCIYLFVAGNPVGTGFSHFFFSNFV